MVCLRLLVAGTKSLLNSKHVVLRRMQWSICAPIFCSNHMNHLHASSIVCHTICCLHFCPNSMIKKVHSPLIIENYNATYTEVHVAIQPEHKKYCYLQELIQGVQLSNVAMFQWCNTSPHLISDAFRLDIANFNSKEDFTALRDSHSCLVSRSQDM